MPRHRNKTFSRLAARRARQKASLILIFFGVICFGVIFSLRAYQEARQKILSFSEVPKLAEEAPEELFPTQILIPKVRINLSVFPSKASGVSWEISEKGASYLLGSGIPGRIGNVIIYGHNKRNLFGPIRWLKQQDEIKVVNKKGEEFIYKIRETKIVSPNEVSVLAPTEEPTLTLYTCTGFMDSQRFVVIAKPSS
ncbi:MAG: sortase [Patescibacteria group bacterium]